MNADKFMSATNGQRNRMLRDGRWYIARSDANGTPVGEHVNVTDSVLDTTGEVVATDNGEQEQAASAILESAYGTTDGVMNGVSWFA